MSISLSDLPDSSRLWIYGADRSFQEAEASELAAGLSAFVDQWTAHGTRLRAAAELFEGRFVVVAADEASARASGCSIDTLVHFLTEAERRFDCALLDGTRLFYRSAEGLESCDRETFRRLAEDRLISAHTPVFDLTLATLGEFRAGRFEQPLSESWHCRLVPEVTEIA